MLHSTCLPVRPFTGEKKNKSDKGKSEKFCIPKNVKFHFRQRVKSEAKIGHVVELNRHEVSNKNYTTR